MTSRKRALAWISAFIVGSSLGACKRSTELESCQGSGDCAGELRCLDGRCLRKLDPERVCTKFLELARASEHDIEDVEEYERECRYGMESPSELEPFEYRFASCIEDCDDVECSRECRRKAYAP